MTGCSGRLFFVDAFNAQAAKLRSQSACRNAQKHGCPLGAAHSSMSNFKCIENMRPGSFHSESEDAGKSFPGNPDEEIYLACRRGIRKKRPWGRSIPEICSEDLFPGRRPTAGGCCPETADALAYIDPFLQ